MPETKREAQFKNIPELIMAAALVAYGIELSDFYVQLIVTGQMRFGDMVWECKCEPERTVH